MDEYCRNLGMEADSDIELVEHESPLRGYLNYARYDEGTSLWTCYPEVQANLDDVTGKCIKV